MALLPFQRKACWGFLCPEKSWRLRPGLNPRTWVLRQHATSRPPKPLTFHYRSKVKLSLLILWRHIDEGEVWIPTSRTLVLGGDELSTTCPGHCTPVKNPSTHWVGDWVGWRGSLDILEKRKMSANAGIQTPDCPACSLVSFARYTMLINPSITEAEVFNSKVL